MPLRWDTRFADGFRGRRWRGWVPLGSAVANRAAFLTTHSRELCQPGVYAIFVPSGYEPRWQTHGLGNVIAPWTARRLHEHWVPEVELVYIGCAGRTPSSRILYERLRDLLCHGAGETSMSGPHKGGERIWQCRKWTTFQLAWKATGPYPEPHDIEVAIGERFRALTGALPFANVRL